jgi:hypothetical protein
MAKKIKNEYGATVKIDEDLLNEVRAAAERETRTVKGYIELAILARLKNNLLPNLPRIGSRNASKKSLKGPGR